MATACILGGLIAVSLILVVGLFALSRLPGNEEMSPQRQGTSRDFKFQATRWLLSIGVFAITVILLTPFATLGAEVLGFVMLSPLFGTMSVLIQSAISEERKSQ